MVPIILLALRRGTLIGLLGRILVGTFQMALDPFFLHPIQVLLDYKLAWGAVGLAGIFRKMPVYTVIFGVTTRFVFHCISDFVFLLNLRLRVRKQEYLMFYMW